jgi:short subunit dehydrogenase-like uncharacterized protein
MPTQRPHEVAIFGATGYTGRQIVRELVDAGRDVVCVGRDRAKLDAIAAKLDRPVHIEVAELTDPIAIEAICASVTTVVNAAGPFAETCEPIASAAVIARTHYVDISGEQQPIRFVFDELHEPASRAEIALIPSAAFYAGLADLLVPVAAGKLDHIDTVDIAYHITDWIPSGAAYINFLRGIGEPITQFDHGFIEVATPAYRKVNFGHPLGIQPTFSYPAPEVFTLPRHMNIGQLRTSVTASTFNTKIPDRLAPGVTKAIRKGLDSPVAPLVEKLLSVTLGSSRNRIDGDPTTFQLTVTIQAGATAITANLAANGIFDITAPIATRIAELTLQQSFDGIGALTPAQVVEPISFLSALAAQGLSYQISTRSHSVSLSVEPQGAITPTSRGSALQLGTE